MTSPQSPAPPPQQQPSAYPANWYPDPAGRHELRFWDGERWTDARAILGKDGKSPVVGEVDWYQGPELRFHLDAEEGTRFTVLFSDGEGWSRAGDLEYRGPGERHLTRDGMPPAEMPVSSGTAARASRRRR